MKKFLKMSFIAAVAVASGYIAYGQSQKMETLSDLTMQNVEALASGESGKVTCANIIADCIPGVDGPYVSFY